MLRRLSVLRIVSSRTQEPLRLAIPKELLQDAVMDRDEPVRSKYGSVFEATQVVFESTQ